MNYAKNIYIGLSLCIQGTPGDPIRLFLTTRFIPVYTGNTINYVREIKNKTVYPCVYREHEMVIEARKIADGLSLCIQGTRFACYQLAPQFRFIPVYTGNTFDLLITDRDFTVYPCVYREHNTPIMPCMILSGLSLCIQGTL